MSQATARVQGLIDQNKVVVFSKSYCPYCKATKSTLSSLDAEFTVYELDQLPDGAETQDALQVISGQRTVPNIFINQKHIGGNSDLQSLSQSGELKKLLREANALKL
ncbi:probable glutaredoxin [Cephalotrichum gorgonifer]|uniref:Probable glutaredoxin n=1 Tax=Cephalotrichum gorgonifer TaxID=2041049 RepID=A0AAE8MR60_9PEZI|nr:probable glutaredoxin [Cephalotrichum gorgonifer]